MYDFTRNSGFGCMNVGKRNRRGWGTEPPRRKLLFFPTPLMILAFILILSAVGCNKENDNPARPSEDVPQQTLQRFSTNHAEASVMRWTLTGDSAQFLDTVIQVQQPTVQIFEDGKVSMTITGDRGEIVRITNDIKVYDNVVGVSENGTLRTNELHWRNHENKLFAPNESEIVRGDSAMVGQEMEGNASLEIVTLKDVKFKLYSKDEQVDASKNQSQ